MQNDREIEIEEIRKENSDLKTRKPRSFILDITDEQYKRLHEKSESVQTTASQLIENFIGDLIDYHRNGADEAMLANDWFERAIESKRRY